MEPLNKPGLKTTEFWTFAGVSGALLALFDRATAVDTERAYTLAGVIAVVLGVCWIVYALTRNDTKSEVAKRETALLRATGRRPARRPPAPERSVWEDPAKARSVDYVVFTDPL